MGDPNRADRELIEVHVGELTQLFNSIDPSPFREKDLDPAAEEYIVGWANDTHRDAPLELLVYVDRPTGRADDEATLGGAVSEFFRQRSLETRRRLRRLFRQGRISLVIGIVCLAISVLLGEAVEKMWAGYGLAVMVRESVLIGGWVAMWRPLETFLYDWWPIRAEARIFDRLSEMPVRLTVGKKETATAKDVRAAGDPRASRPR
jgi:hypothetical protein